MSCINPLYALRLGTFDGKQKLKLLSRSYTYDVYCQRYGSENIIVLPCGHCFNCKTARAKSWAYRCVLEASLYPDNAFITLTYDNKHLPKDKKLSKKHFRLFIKRLRVLYPGIRYFACGEYGPQTLRPHYHAIVFNWFPKDAQAIGPGEYGGYRYLSKELDKIWANGSTELGDVSLASAGYVARYTLKKLGSNTGEFITMSLRPGIGFRYFQEHIYDIYDTDKIYFNFGKNKAVTPFRYFDKLFNEIDAKKLEELKQVRVSSANLSVASRLFSAGCSCVERLNETDGSYSAYKSKFLKRGGN